MAKHSGEALRLLNHPILVALFDEQEKNALERAVTAKLDDDETRRTALGEVRAIRSVRRKLDLAAQGRVTLPDDPSE